MVLTIYGFYNIRVRNSHLYIYKFKQRAYDFNNQIFVANNTTNLM